MPKILNIFKQIQQQKMEVAADHELFLWVFCSSVFQHWFGSLTLKQTEQI